MKALGDSKLSSKFQATIPRTVRNLMGLKAADLLVFVLEGNQVLLKRGKVEVEDFQVPKSKVLRAVSK